MPGNAWSSVGHFEIRGRPDLIHFELAGAEGPAVICKFVRLSLAGAESPAIWCLAQWYSMMRWRTLLSKKVANNRQAHTHKHKDADTHSHTHKTGRPPRQTDRQTDGH